MKKNMGNTDRIIRIIIAAFLGYFYISGMVTGVAGIIIGILAVVFFLTSLIGFCPLYTVFRLNTNRENK